MVQNNVLNPKLTVIVQKDIINALICIIVSLTKGEICVQDLWGQYVAQITKNGPVDNTELREEDIITKIDNIELNTMNDLREYIYTKKPNDVVILQVKRGKLNKQIEIVLGKRY